MAAFTIHDLRSPVQGAKLIPIPTHLHHILLPFIGSRKGIFIAQIGRRVGRDRAAVGILFCPVTREESRESVDIRVLVDEAGGIVDLIVDDHIQVLLGGMLAHIRVGEFLGVGHCGFFCLDLFPCLSCQDFSRTL